MARSDLETGRTAFLAFGQRVQADDAFDDLLAARGWQREPWQPTFGEAGEQRIENGWDKQVLRRPLDGPASDPEPRMMVASASRLPSLYYAEWHYIDFVLSCVGNVSEAARILGIRRSTLQRKRKKHPPER
jgi:DNA-binding NtrC family response regulator